MKPQVNTTYLTLPSSFYRPAVANPYPDARLIAYNEELASELGVEFESEQEKLEILTGFYCPENMTPVALAYAGHQFGHFVPELGDGRALLLGEGVSSVGERFDLQLKGSGQTPFSRRGDGQSALGPVIREYLLSEAMHALGIPTTRALAAAVTGKDVYRDRVLPGGIMTRVASSHIRVGTFEYFACRNEVASLEELLKYSIKRHYPDMSSFDPVEFLEKFSQRYADLVSSWMSVGFIHGVMNTDNVSISGETLDYGPCAFMDRFKYSRVFSSIDRSGRYAYDQQPLIAQWNCARLADCLSVMMGEKGFQSVDSLSYVVTSFQEKYKTSWLEKMKKKIGLLEADPNDEKLIHSWLDLLQDQNLDFTASFRTMGNDFGKSFSVGESEIFESFFDRWRHRLKVEKRSESDVKKSMNDVNPAIIPRNHVIEQAIQSANEGDFALFQELQEALKFPYSDPVSDLKGLSSVPVENDSYRTFCGT